MKRKSRISEICVLVRVVASGDRGTFYRKKKGERERETAIRKRGIGTCDKLHWLFVC